MPDAITHWTQLADESETAADVVRLWKRERPHDRAARDLAAWLLNRAAAQTPESGDQMALTKGDTNWLGLALQLLRDSAAELTW